VVVMCDDDDDDDDDYSDNYDSDGALNNTFLFQRDYVSFDSANSKAILGKINELNPTVHQVS